MTCVKCHIAGVVSSILIHGSALFWFVSSEPGAVQQSQEEPLALELAMFQVEEDAPVAPAPEPVSEPEPVPQPVPIPEPILKPGPIQEPVSKEEPVTVQEKKPVRRDPPKVAIKPVTEPVVETQKNDFTVRVARAENEYRYLIVKKIERNKFYPRRVKKMGKEGDVTVEFILNRDGSIQNLKVVKSHGPSALKKAALKAISVSALFPPFPALSPRQSWTFKTSLQYRLQ